MNIKSEYKLFCSEESGIPIYSYPWWLDAVCGEENWDVILVKRKEQIVASFPYLLFKDKGMKCIGMPQLTQKLGVYIKYPQNQSEMARLSYEKEILTEIINRLPACDFFRVNFDYSYTNWLPFYWQGFSQTTYYTYVVEDIADMERVYTCFDRSKKKNIKKAQGLVEFGFDLSAEEFYQNHQMTLKKQGKEISYSYAYFTKLYKAAYREGAGRTIYAKDKEGHLHAALFVVWDKVSAYDLISTIDPEFRDSGASSLLVYEMMKFLSSKVKRFDFEGSMIEGVENSFRKFGASQKAYFSISKRNSRRFIVLKGLKDIWNGIRG